MSSQSSLRQAEREFRAWGFLFFPTEYTVNNDRTRTRDVNNEDDRVHELVDIIAEEVSDVDRAANRRRYLAIKRENEQAACLHGNELRSLRAKINPDGGKRRNVPAAAKVNWPGDPVLPRSRGRSICGT